MNILKVKKLDNFVGFDSPTYDGDCGYNVYSTIEVTLEPLERKALPLGVAVEIPYGCMGRIEERSGNSVKLGLTTIGNIIDSTYRGEIHAIVVNISNKPVTIPIGFKIAQLVLHNIETPVIVFVNELKDSTRDTKKFGSSDKCE